MGAACSMGRILDVSLPPLCHWPWGAAQEGLSWLSSRPAAAQPSSCLLHHEHVVLCPTLSMAVTAWEAGRAPLFFTSGL
jgi:hypothetical protein